MENKTKELISKLVMELAWWGITAILAYMVVEPLWSDFVKPDFIYDSIVNIVVFITLTRYIFGLKYTLLSHFQAGKFIIIFACIPFAFYLIQEFFAYQDFLDQEGTAEFMDYFRPDIKTDRLYAILTYTTNQISFFGVGAVLTVIILPFRLLISFWRVYNNTGGV